MEPSRQKNSKQNGGRKSRRMTKRKSHARRHTHKGNRGTTSWPQFVKKTYLDMKRTDKNATFKDAMKEASKRKAAGQF